MNISIVHQSFKCIRGEFSVGVGTSAGWGVDIGVGAGNGSADGITFGIYYGYDMGSSDGLFDGFSVGKHMGEYIDGSLEYNMDLYLIYLRLGWYVNYGDIISVGNLVDTLLVG